MGTGKEQRITITSSTKLTDDEINAKIKEAAQYAEEDKKKKEEVELRNQAETLIYETDKNLKDLGDKLSESEKAAITSAKDDLARTLENGTAEDIKDKLEKLTEQFHTISAKMYQNTQNADPNMGGQAEDGGNANMGGQSDAADDNVVDADYEVVDEDKKDNN